MILCVTLNPCLDRTLVVPPWRPGDLVRGTATRAVVGGKGNNVARALARLGRSARPVTLLGGDVGNQCESLLRDDDRLDPIVVASRAATRVILTVRTGDTAEQTAFFDPDPAITPAEAAALLDRIDAELATGQVQALTLSGSSPSPATHGLYSDLVARARARNVAVLVDTYGPALDAFEGSWPEILQLNQRELAGHLRLDRAALTATTAAQQLLRWGRLGVRLAIVTNGRRPALACLDQHLWRVHPAPVEVVNPIGSGDCLLAGLADGWTRGLEPQDLLRHGMACAAANTATWDAGAIDRPSVETLTPLVRVEPFETST